MATARHVDDRKALAPLVPSPIYRTFWKFAAERQQIFYRRVRGSPAPWTSDPILATYRFTNVFRAADRVSQFLIREVIYRDGHSRSATEICFRILLFKFFNRIGTWQLLERELGIPTYSSFAFEDYDAVLTRALEAGKRVYSGAYIIPPASGVSRSRVKHRTHLRLIAHIMEDDFSTHLAKCRSMQEGYELLLGYPSIGPFLAYQYLVDLNYSAVTSFSEMDFVVPGPGAKDGIRKCFENLAGLSEAELIRFLVDHQEEECDRLGEVPPTLWGRRLHLIDCQNLFCEISKYSRVAHPQVRGTSGRTRIKQHFDPDSAPIDYWFPPAWGINGRVKEILPPDGNAARWTST